MTSSDAIYTGRFAPSPSGELHFGSLVAALASWLDARHNRGRWLLRMEDLDPAREPPGAAEAILRTLELFGLHWDGEVLYQSTRLEAYQTALEALDAAGLIYACSCPRKRIRELGGVYDGHCRLLDLPSRGNALRLKTATELICFDDLVQGRQCRNLSAGKDDFIVRRRDGLFAYQLAVVVDDLFQQITHVVRGADLLDSTPGQCYLQELLQAASHPPVYAHIPVATNSLGQKLSKQHFAEPVNDRDVSTQLHRALCFLGQAPEPVTARMPAREQLQIAVECWDIQAVPKLANIRV